MTPDISKKFPQGSAGAEACVLQGNRATARVAAGLLASHECQGFLQPWVPVVLEAKTAQEKCGRPIQHTLSSFLLVHHTAYSLRLCHSKCGTSLHKGGPLMVPLGVSALRQQQRLPLCYESVREELIQEQQSLAPERGQICLRIQVPMKGLRHEGQTPMRTLGFVA